MPNDEVKLAACPFCGGRAKVHGRGRCWVECSQCHVETPGDETTNADAIAAWNRRATPSTVSGETVPAAWRYRYKTDRTGEAWDEWMVVTVDPNDWDWAPAWHDFECQPLYANHEARGDGVRVTDAETRNRAIIAGIETSERLHAIDHTFSPAYLGMAIAQDALEAALPPLGDGRAEIVEALKPFAALGQYMVDEGFTTKPDDATMWGFDRHDLTYGDFRRAAAAIRSLSNPGGGLS